jgi:hypothetical protein
MGRSLDVRLRSRWRDLPTYRSWNEQPLHLSVLSSHKIQIYDETAVQRIRRGYTSPIHPHNALGNRQTQPRAAS